MCDDSTNWIQSALFTCMPAELLETAWCVVSGPTPAQHDSNKQPEELTSKCKVFIQPWASLKWFILKQVEFIVVHYGPWARINANTFIFLFSIFFFHCMENIWKCYPITGGANSHTPWGDAVCVYCWFIIVSCFHKETNTSSISTCCRILLT